MIKYLQKTFRVLKIGKIDIYNSYYYFLYDEETKQQFSAIPSKKDCKAICQTAKLLEEYGGKINYLYNKNLYITIIYHITKNGNIRVDELVK